MVKMKCLEILVGIIFVSCVAGDVPYKELYFKQTKDHFNYVSYGEQTFMQRYLIQDKWFNGTDTTTGPIFFYTGNEGDIVEFWKNTGFVFDIAPQFQALVVFAEHRYYGKSMPFGDDSFKGKNIGLLTIEQALADYAVIISTIKQQYHAKKSAVITFGGSYGGMLSAYMRFKYPNVVTGAIAASAPIYLMSPKIDSSQYFVKVTNDFKESNPKCSANVREAFTKMESMASSGQTGLDQIAEKFGLCSKINSTGYQHLLGWIRNAFVSLAMFDYPYPTDFEGKIPAFPVDLSCGYIVNASDLVSGLARMTALYYNATAVPCFDIWTEYVACADPSGCGLGPASSAWDIQACAEVPMLFTTDGVQDMFPPMPYTKQMRIDYCQKKWGITPRDSWMNVDLWGTEIYSTSNIVFSNGGKDPWAFAGVLHNLSDNITAVIIPDGAHHLDLRGANVRDPPDVFKARELEKYHIRLWINTAYKNGLKRP